MTVFRPADAAEAQQVIAWAAAEAQPLDIIAGGSKRALGRPAQAEHAIELSRLTGIVDYEPSELVLTAHAATPMALIEAQVAAHRQMLVFEPPDWRGLLGNTGSATLGGVVACNLAGPRRVRAGAARDHFLGFSAINGWGDAWKAGGRVVKNVTGYDLCKLQAGAYGTLSVLTEVSVRVMPKPEMACTVMLHGLGDDDAIAVLSQALNTQHEVSAAAHLPALVARRSGVAAVAGSSGAVTVLRLEGPEPSVAFRVDAVEAVLGPMREQRVRLDAAATELLWSEIGAVSPLLDPGGRCVWRVCTAPSAAPAVLRAVQARYPATEAFYDWGGGLLWLGLDLDEAGPDAGATCVRAAVRHGGGHATLVVAPETVRASVPVFEPAQGALAALSSRVKSSFDPQRILNPGRMQEGC